MEHIDWIVSFVIFVFVILAIITAIPRFLPDNLKQEDIYTSKIVYSQLNNSIEKYSIYSDNNLQEEIFFIEEIDKGRANSSYLIDQNVLFINYLKNTNFYLFDANNQLQTPRKNLFKEKIIDENSLTNFQLKQGVIINYKGEAYAFQETVLESKEDYSNFYFEYVVEPLDMNVYFNHQDVNNFSLCTLDANTLNLFDQNSNGQYLIDSKDVNFNDEEYFINLKVFSNYNGKVNCTINDVTVENLNQSSVQRGKIILKNKNPQYINSFEIYKNNFLEINSNEINTSNFKVKITGKEADVNISKEGVDLGNIKLSYENNLDASLINNNQPGMIKDSLSKQRLVVFPNTEQMIAIIDTEDVNFQISNGIEINNYDYEIEFTTEYYTWIKMDVLANSQKTIYLRKISGYQPETNFIKNYNPSTNPQTTITNQGNGLYRIDVNNLEGGQLLDYEVRVDNNSLNLTSISESLLITDSNFINSSRMVLINKAEGKYIMVNFLDKDRNLKNCQVSIIDNGFNIDCENKTYITLKITDNIENLKDKYFIGSEKIITYETIEDINSQVEENYNYFIKIYNNKENIEIGEYGYSGDFKILEKISKYLNEKGQEEIVKVLIKPN